VSITIRRGKKTVQKIILQKFEEWTKGLGPKESRIAVFEHIRDIPYAIVPGLGHPVHGPARMLALNRGYCEPKHVLLYTMYQRLGIPTKYATYPFSWSAQDISYPRKIRKLVDGMPMGYHLACKAYINEKWVLIDATWDLPLKRLGFPINESWDGISDTLNAVKPEEEITHENEGERTEYVSKIGWPLLTKKEKVLSLRFYDQLNNWLEEIRPRHK
jgi:transglutaminase-like putative cysteine protease